MPTEFEFDVFISYNRRDAEWVRGELLTRIEKAGLRAFIDYRDFTRGAHVINECERGAGTCRKTLIVLTPDYIKSGWGEIENIMVQTLDPANRELRLIPLLKTACDKPLRIGALTHIDFTSEADQDLAWRQLLTALGKPPEAAPPREPERGGSPSTESQRVGKLHLKKQSTEQVSQQWRQLSQLGRSFIGTVAAVLEAALAFWIEVCTYIAALAFGVACICIAIALLASVGVFRFDDRIEFAKTLYPLRLSIGLIIVGIPTSILSSFASRHLVPKVPEFWESFSSEGMRRRAYLAKVAAIGQCTVALVSAGVCGNLGIMLSVYLFEPLSGCIWLHYTIVFFVNFFLGFVLFAAYNGMRDAIHSE
jgi:hypothetical protein